MPQSVYCYKVLIVAQSYLKCMSIYNMLPWQELDCKPIIEMNASSLVRKIKKLHPDILIAYGEVGWVRFGALADAAVETGRRIQAILLTGDESHEAATSFQGSSQVIPLSQLSADRLRQTLEQAKQNIAHSIASSLPTEGQEYPATDNETFLLHLKQVQGEPVMIVRMLLEKPPVSPAEQLPCQKILTSLVQQAQHGSFFQEQGGNYCILLPILSVAAHEQLQGIEQDLYYLRRELCSLTGGLCVSTSSLLVSLSEAPKEYRQTKQLEKYRFFCSDIPILSAAILTSNQASPNWQAVIDCTDSLLYATICGDDEQIGSLLQGLFFDHIKPARNMSYFRAVWTQLQSIYEQVCYLTDTGSFSGDCCDAERFWSIEQALQFQIQRFHHLTLVRGKRHKALNPLVLKALMIVIRSHDTPLYIGDIAGQIGTSESYLSRIFKQQLGISIIECVRRMRICSAATEMLRGEHRIKYLAEKHGFADPKYFSKVFRQVMGMSPSDYIQTHCRNQAADREVTL